MVLPSRLMPPLRSVLGIVAGHLGNGSFPAIVAAKDRRRDQIRDLIGSVGIRE